MLLVAALRWLDPPTSAFMLARRWQDPPVAIDCRWQPRERIAAPALLAMIAAEDQRFPEHAGFDLDSIRDALQQGGTRGRGASTISQQVAKNLFLWSGRSWLRKGLEAWFTVWIELLWDKPRILEVYANIAEFGDGVYGVEAAAQRYFGKPAAALSAREGARLAAVLPNPRDWSVTEPGAYVRWRVRWIEQQMQQLGGPGLIERL